MKAFIAMPFRDELEGVYTAIREACERAEVHCVRADEILEPGSIINQIFRAISEADCLIAEVSLPNPNVYYEIALAHCQELPSVLVSHEDAVAALPFDIRHNRVLVYKKGQLDRLVRTLTATLRYIKDSFVEQKGKPSLEQYVEELAGAPDGPSALAPEPVVERVRKIALQELTRGPIEDIEKTYGLKNARIVRHEFLGKDGFAITVEDALGDKVVFHIDVNGIIRKASRL